MKDHYVFLILGLQRNKPQASSKMPFYWKLRGIEGEIFRMNWQGPDTYSERLAVLLKKIDAKISEGKTVSMIGVSAGASTALNSYLLRRNSMHRVIYVCGRLGGIEQINRHYFVKYPVFEESMIELTKNISKLTTEDKKKMMTMEALADDLVGNNDNIEGVMSKRIWSVGHFVSFIVALTFYKRSIAKFIKSTN